VRTSAGLRRSRQAADAAESPIAGLGQFRPMRQAAEVEYAPGTKFGENAGVAYAPITPRGESWLARLPRNAWATAALLVSAFFFRLWVGLAIGLSRDDAKQVYLSGLKYYLTGAWPYFGADVDWRRSVQVPGALQALVVGLPFYVAPVPEAPFVVLNLLSFSSVCLLAWYAARRLPHVPRVLIWAWLLTAPWTLDESTYVYNPSYVLTGATIFFIGALETYPTTRRGLLSLSLANFMMGFGLLWVMQFHMSYAILLPYAAASLIVQLRDTKTGRAKPLLAFAAGAAVIGIFLLPTCLRYGWHVVASETAAMIQPNPRNLSLHWRYSFDILARFVSFATYQTAGFVGGNVHERLRFLADFFWLAPVILLVTAAGIVQVVAIIWMALFTKKPAVPEWRAMRLLFAVTILLLYAGFAFCRKVPRSHTFYVTFPVAMLFSLYCWNEFLQRRAGQAVAAALIALGIVFQVTFVIHKSTEHPWALERQEIERALKIGDYQESAFSAWTPRGKRRLLEAAEPRTFGHLPGR
jgi:hypothetical protein